MITFYDHYKPITLETKAKEITNANIIEVEAGTTGFRGGDSGHGGRTYLRLSDLGGTDINIRFNDKSWKDDTIPWQNISGGTVEVEFGGDAELETIIGALEFMLETLKSQKEK